MRRYFILYAIIFISSISFAQITTTELAPKGVYSTIMVSEQNRMINLLIEPTTRLAAVDTIFTHISRYNPPVLYMFSQALFYIGEEQNGVDWYLFAQLNALYDANRCADNTAKQATIILEMQFRPELEEFIKKNKKEYLESVDRAVKLFKVITQDYDIRWINLHGMDAISASLNENNDSDKILTVPQEQWAKIKEETIKSFISYNKK